MPEEPGTIRRIVWREIFPWFRLILQTFPVAIEFRKLFLSASSLMIMIAGWWGLAWLFGGSILGNSRFEAYQFWPWEQASVPQAGPDNPVTSLFQPVFYPIFGAWQLLTAPFRQLFSLEFDFWGLLFYSLCGLWALVVWSLSGGVLVRMAALQLGREERTSLGEGFQHSLQKWMGYFTAPLYPLSGMIGLTVLLGLIGLMMQTDVGLLIAGILWPLHLLGAVFLALLFIGTALGWPLMWATIGVEGSDAFDALSRSFNYVYQRPFSFLFYVTLAIGFGALTWILVSWFFYLVGYFCLWAATWGAGEERIKQIVELFPPIAQHLLGGDWLVSENGTSETIKQPGYAGAMIIVVWYCVLYLLLLGYALSYFWTAATAVYLLLRQDNDGTEIDDIHIEHEDQFEDLPPLEGIASGLSAIGTGSPEQNSTT
ncbi:Hypothetical protein PBC10988_6450 [Planctomycetales bacterium 10988]|nr:Hypothetical protein PBC10988_6450 [Planctomycetales bacterium 10988]